MSETNSAADLDAMAAMHEMMGENAKLARRMIYDNHNPVTVGKMVECIDAMDKLSIADLFVLSATLMGNALSTISENERPIMGLTFNMMIAEAMGQALAADAEMGDAAEPAVDRAEPVPAGPDQTVQF